MKLSYIHSHSQVLWSGLHGAFILIFFSASVFWIVLWWRVLPLSVGSWDGVTGWRGRVDSAVLSSILQRNEHGLFSPPPRRRGDAVTPQVWSPSPETTGPLGRSGRGRLVLSQPLHAPTLRGRICLLCSRAGDLSVTASTGSETMCMWISQAETYSISHNVRPRSASQGSRASRAKYKHAQHMSTSLLSSPCAFSGLHLNGQPFRYYSPDASFSFFGYVFLFQCSPCLHLIKVPTQTYLKQSQNKRGTVCEGALCHAPTELSCFNMSTVWPFCIPRPRFQSHVLACSSTFLVLFASRVCGLAK